MYSQFGEDEIIRSYFGDHVGLCLDIGAWGVKDFSNSRLFIEAGWSAVLVEFSPMPVHELVKEYGKCDRVHIIQAAITAEPQHVTRFEITEDGISSADPDHIAKWKASGFPYYGQLWVPTLSVRALLDQFFGTRTIDYASVDTEGTSADVALALMESDWRPGVVVVEYDQRLPELLTRGEAVGYRPIHTNQCNVIMARSYKWASRRDAAERSE